MRNLLFRSFIMLGGLGAFSGLGALGCQPPPAQVGGASQALGGPPSVELHYPGFAAGDVATVGSARVLVDGTLRLTSADDQGHTGAAWLPFAVPILGGFHAEISFRIGNAGGLGGGGDGLAFVVQSGGPSVIGHAGCEMGYGDLPRSAVVELDTFQNDNFCEEIADPDGNHVAIHANLANPQQGTSASETMALGHAELPFSLKDGAVHRMVVDYDAGAMSVALDGAPALTGVAIDLAPFATADGTAWFGFTSATAAAFADHDIIDLTVEGRQPGACPFVCGDASAPEPLDGNYCMSAGLFCSCDGRSVGEPALPIACAPEAGFCRSECGYDDTSQRLACVSIGEAPADCPVGGGGNSGGVGPGNGGGPGPGGGSGSGSGGGDGGGGSPVPCPCSVVSDTGGELVDTDACGQTACGGDSNVWMCTLAGWTDLGFACAGDGGGSGGGATCACNTATLGGRPWVTHACGRVACDTDGEEWVCTPNDFTQIGTRCQQGFTPTVLCTEGPIAPEPEGGLGSPFRPPFEAAVMQLVATALQSGDPSQIALVTALVDSLWQVKLGVDRAAMRAMATDPARFDHFADRGWQFVGLDWTTPRVDRVLDGLERIEAVYGPVVVDVRTAPWTIVHDSGLPDEAKSEVLSRDTQFLGLPRPMLRIRIEIDSRESPISTEQQIELAVHALHHAVIAAAPAPVETDDEGPPITPGVAPRGVIAPAFVVVPGSFGDSWVGTIWPGGAAIEPSLVVSQFALLGAGEDLADSGTSYVSTSLGLGGALLTALAGGRRELFEQFAPPCGCPLLSGELLRVGESFCDDSKQTLSCTKSGATCKLNVKNGSCVDPFQQQCFCNATTSVQYGSCDQEICDPLPGGGWQAKQCVNRTWQSMPVSCNGCPPQQTCIPQINDPKRQKLAWVNRRRCQQSCAAQPVDLQDLVPGGGGQLRLDAARAYWGLRAAYRASVSNAAAGIGVASAYRSFAAQVNAFESNRNLESNSCVKGMAVSALPGHSEHQTGDAFDASAWNINRLTPGPKDAIQAKFIEHHACKFGFVRSYESGEMSETGYYPEPWHWRYVGPARALFLRPVDPVTGFCALTGPTIEEYLAEHQDEAETGSCGQCPAVTRTKVAECLAMVPPLPAPDPSEPPPPALESSVSSPPASLPSSSPASVPSSPACPSCPPFVPPPSTKQIAIVQCGGTEPSITIGVNFASPYQIAIVPGGVVSFANQTGEPVLVTEPGAPAVPPHATACIQFGTAGDYGVYEIVKGASVNVLVH